MHGNRASVKGEVRDGIRMYDARKKLVFSVYIINTYFLVCLFVFILINHACLFPWLIRGFLFIPNKVLL